MLLSICIATYKRPILLEKLLKSLLDQKRLEGFDIEIIVVDNDHSKSAEPTVNYFNKSGFENVRYFVESEPNISLARNLAVNKSQGKYILFIDDDEFADEFWIINLLNALEQFSADAVFGAIQFYFDSSTPKWIQDCFLFDNISYETGSEAISTRTGNCLVKANLLKSLKGPFDPKYGITGGSDTKLFEGIKNNQNVKFINSAEAVTFEYVPTGRANLKWMIRRVFRNGNDYCRRIIDFNKSFTLLLRIKCFFWGFSFALISLFLCIIFIPSKRLALNWFLKLVSNVGKMFASLNLIYSEYRNSKKAE